MKGVINCYQIPYNLQITTYRVSLILIFLILCLPACSLDGKDSNELKSKIRIIFDTDANNEVDDQHALAYLLFSGDNFDVVGVTVNATSSLDGFLTPSHIDEHYDEAKRVMQLCGELYSKIPLLKGANDSFEEIKEHIDQYEFDGHAAVNFIIDEALKESDEELIILAVGKLTNVALALKKEPRIASNIKVVWLGSNYPNTGEHNKVWDIRAMNYILDAEVLFEIVTVRSGESTGTATVRVTKNQILHRMPGKGPRISEPIVGRHGEEFDNWGDYSVNLFENFTDMRGDPPSRPLYDMAAVAVLKNSSWAEAKEIPAPIFINDEWIERPDNPRSIILWENFDIYGIMNDFFLTMNNPVLVGQHK